MLVTVDLAICRNHLGKEGREKAPEAQKAQKMAKSLVSTDEKWNVKEGTVTLDYSYSNPSRRAMKLLPKSKIRKGAPRTSRSYRLRSFILERKLSQYVNYVT